MPPSWEQIDSATLQCDLEDMQADSFALIFQKPLGQACVESPNFCFCLTPL